VRLDERTLRPQGSRIELAQHDLRQLGLFPTDWHPSGLASAFVRIWTAVQVYPTPSRLYAFDPGSGMLLKAVVLPGEVSKRGSITSISAGEDSLWLTLYGPAGLQHQGEYGGVFAPGSALRIDPSTGRVTERVTVGAGAVAAATVGDVVWVANYLDDTVSRIDASTRRVVGTIPVGGGPTAIALEDGISVAPTRSSFAALVTPSCLLGGSLSHDPTLGRDAVLLAPGKVSGALRRRVEDGDNLTGGVQVFDGADDVEVDHTGLVADGFPAVDHSPGFVDIVSGTDELATA
jgi:YVTN family beta-propeller protein